VVPWMTDSAVQCMPAWTSDSGMIGAAACAAGAPATLAPSVARMSARRRTDPHYPGPAGLESAWQGPNRRSGDQLAARPLTELDRRAAG